MRRVTTFLAMFLCAGAWSADPASPAIAAAPVAMDRYPVRDIAFAGGVRGIPGVVYWRLNGHRPLTLDLYLPPAAEAPKPLVVFIHGGAWLRGDSHRSGAFEDFPSVLAARGYVVASLDYRLSGEAIFPAQVQDVKAAIRWLRIHAGQYGIDPARVVAWGPSAGGHLAALAATSCQAAALEPRHVPAPDQPDAPVDPVTLPEPSDCVQGAVVWYGVFDLSTIAAQARKIGALSRDVADAPEWRLLGCFGAKCAPAQLHAASPSHYVDGGDPPILLVVGDRDRIVPPAQTLEMAEILRAADVRHEVTVLSGIDHNFLGETPEATRAAHLRALDLTFDFIDRTTGTKPK